MEIDGQDPLFDKARRDRDEGIARSERNAREAWNRYAKAYLRWYLERSPTYFGDDIWASGLADPPNDRRAMGARVQEAIRLNWIRSFEPYPRFRPSTQANLRKTEEYVSVIYKGPLDGPHFVAAPVAPVPEEPDTLDLVVTEDGIFVVDDE